MSKLPSKHEKGISLIEVLIAVVVLSFGMLALASLQGQLFRAGAESKARATAAAFAQGQIEELRSFASLTGGTDPYSSIATGTFGSTANAYTSDSGVDYYGCSQIRRFVYDPATKKFTGPAGALPTFTVNSATKAVACGDAGDPNVAKPVSATIPELKEVTTSIGWFDQSGELKVVQLTDTIAAISPDDALQLAKTPPEPTRGPEMLMKPITTASNPGVVPIAVGDGLSSASTNPTPTQFVDDVSSVTNFDVLTFAATDSLDAVKIQRNINVSAVSCVCSLNGDPKSTALNPAYEPAVWNGKVLSYLPPATAPVGRPIGTPVVSSSDSAIKTLCTACCRDHHDSNNKASGVDAALRVDPYRPLNADGSHNHFGFKKQGQGYILDTLLPVGAQTDNEYVEACRMVRVGGIMRVAVDADQSSLVVTPLTADQSNFQQTDFIDRYSSFVKAYATEAVAGRPSDYPAAPTTLPSASAAIKTSYQDVLEPPAIKYSDSAAQRKLISLGLYIDYLSPDTIKAFNCASSKNNTGDCTGLGTRDPLEYIPFYAVNVASLGKWESKDASVVTIDGAVYNNQGSLATQGGLANWGAGSSQTEVLGQEEINISNSGLTATVPIDDDDEASTSFFADALGFLKTLGVPSTQPTNLLVKVGASSTITLSKIGVSSPAGISPCNYDSKAKTDTCIIESTSSASTVRLSNYTTKSGNQITNRKICLPNDARISSVVLNSDGAIEEYLDVTISAMNTTDHVLTIEIVEQASSCDQATVSLTP